MTTVRFYNSLTQSKDIFTPFDPQHVRLYVCGPTVYDRIHVGNARSKVVFDVVFRLLKALFPRVTYVRNITDVDDKIMARAQERGISPQQLTQETIPLFFQDMRALHTLEPTHQPRATEYVPAMIQMIQTLIAAGHAYLADHHVLFEIQTDGAYGSLSKASEDDRIAGARVEVAAYKKHPGDFVLWKPAMPGDAGWESPWGYGRPGWHIECSAMSAALLGPCFDIHGGGQDLKFPHHENEQAQSRCAHHGAEMAQVWLHNGLITLSGQKMSKSLGHFVLLHHALQNHPGEVIRYFFLSTHYRHALDWSSELLDMARASVDRLYRALKPYADALDPDVPFSFLDAGDEAFKQALTDDLNTPYALHLLHQWASTLNRGDAPHPVALARQLWQHSRFLGLLASPIPEWFQSHGAVGSIGDDATPSRQTIEQYIEERRQARTCQDFQKADALREELKNLGILLEDQGDHTEWRFDPSFKKEGAS